MTLITILLLTACGDKDPGESIEPGECAVDTGGSTTDTGGEPDTGEDDGSGGEDSGDGTDTGDPPDTEVDTSHCDATGYLPWLEALVAEYEETGRCPEIPTEVPMLDGTMYTPRAEVRAVIGSHAQGDFRFIPDSAWNSVVSVSSYELCETGSDEAAGPGDWIVSGGLVFDGYGPGTSVSAGFAGRAPRFATHLWQEELGHPVYLLVIAKEWLESGEEIVSFTSRVPSGVDVCGYAMMCLEDYGSTPGPYFETEGETPGGHASGWIYVHTEQWWDTTERPSRPSAESGPMDLIVHLDGELDCTTFAEDTAVSGWKLDPDDYPWPNWSSLCDGVDNDYDGEIDEGRDLRPRRNLDRDDNGIPDCQQDCDGDGIPNYDDLDDLDECTPTGLESGVVPGGPKPGGPP